MAETDDCTLPRAGGELVGDELPLEVELLELDELLLDLDLEGDRLEVLPEGEGVLEPDLDFVFDVVFEVFTCVSLDVRLSDGSTVGVVGTYAGSDACVGVVLYLEKVKKFLVIRTFICIKINICRLKASYCEFTKEKHLTCHYFLQLL